MINPEMGSFSVDSFSGGVKNWRSSTSLYVKYGSSVRVFFKQCVCAADIQGFADRRRLSGCNQELRGYKRMGFKRKTWRGASIS